MNIYLVLFFLLVFFSFTELFYFKKAIRKVYWFFVFVLIIFVGLRGEGVGFDYYSYKKIFQEIASGNKQNILIEPSYLLLNKLIYSVTSFTSLLFVMAVGAITIKSSFIAKYSKYPLTSLVIYFAATLLINDMGQIRFGIAISFLMISFKYMIEKNTVKLWLFWIIAVSFHYSSLVAIPVLFIYNYKFKINQIFIILIFFSIFYVINIEKILQDIAVFMPSYFEDKIKFYTFEENSFGKPLGVNLSLMLRLSILFLFFFIKNRNSIDNQMNVIFNLYLYGVILYMVFNTNSEFATRCSAYFKVTELIIIPIFIQYAKGYKNKILIWMCIMCYAFYSLGKIVFDNQFGDPYHNYTNILF